MTSASKAKIPYLDMYRCLAIMAVVLIHTTAYPVAFLSKESFMYPIYFVLNKSSMFAVPVFIFLSAVVLFYNYEHLRGTKVWLAYAKKRFMYIVVPYVSWSLFYFLVLQLGIRHSLTMDDTVDFFSRLLWGRNYSHLYFMIIIIQLYALFPFLLVLIRKAAFLRRYLFVFAILAQIGFIILNKTVFKIYAPGSVIFFYSLYVLLGAYVGLHYDQVIRVLKRRAGLWIGAALCAGVVAVGKEAVLFIRPGWGTTLNWIEKYSSLSNYTYIVLSCIALLLFSAWMHNMNAKLTNLFVALGVGSFAIYLSHPFVLLVWRRYLLNASSPLLYHACILSGGIAALALPWIGYRIVRRFRWSWIVIGR